MADSNSFTISPGEELPFLNRNAVAITYRLDFGAAGSLRVVMPPGAEFTVIGGAVNIHVNIEATSAPGVRLVDRIVDPRG